MSKHIIETVKEMIDKTKESRASAINFMSLKDYERRCVNVDTLKDIKKYAVSIREQVIIDAVDEVLKEKIY